MESLSSPRLRASAGDFFAVPCSPVAGGMRSFPNSSFQFSSAISVRNSGLRACLKSRSRGKKVHFLNCQTWHFPGHWKPRHLGYKAETARVNVHDLHHVPSARGGSPTTDPPPPRTQRSPHRCGLRCAPKNPGVTAEGYEHGIVAPLDAAPVCRSATDSTRLHPGSFIQGVSHNRHILDCTRAERRRRFADTLNNTVLAVGSDDKMRQSRFGIHCSSHEADIRSKRTTPAFRIP